MTKPFGDPKISKVLVVGHEPKLQKSKDIAEYSLYANYYFKEKSSDPSEKRKFIFAKKLYEYLMWLTSGKYKPEEFYVTNLTNQKLERKEEGGTVLIDIYSAKKGAYEIGKILKNGSFKMILAMSPQPNYWLQKTGICEKDIEFLKEAEPKNLNTDYEPKIDGCFKRICGKQLNANGIPLFPILHVKQYSLNGPAFKSYLPLLKNCINIIKEL